MFKKCFSTLFVIFLSGCSVNYSVSKHSSSYNFDEAISSMYINQVQVKINNDQDNYNEFIAQMPEQRIAINPLQSKIDKDTSVLLTLHVASNEPLTEKEILEITVQAAKYDGTKVLYNSHNSLLNICKSKSLGFSDISETTNGVHSNKRLINISSPNDKYNSPCLFLVEIQPNLNSSIDLSINGQLLLSKKMNKKEKFDQLYQKFRDQTINGGIGIYPSSIN
ncbi:MAG: hypothetical protein KDD58_01175 [Bdellovibrionales bacterium]|nr:hypothetical protein [Bdellovibrionales bacterium]